MPNHNSQGLVFYHQLLVRVYHDLVSAIVPQSEMDRDLYELEKRVHCEGLSFLTKTLPRLGKAIDASLSKGTILTTHGFKLKPCTQLPCFMGTLFRIVFRSDGTPWFASGGPDFLKTHRVKEVEGHTDPGCGNTPRLECKLQVNPSREAAVLALRALRQVCFCFYKLNLPYHAKQEARVLADFVETDAELPPLGAELSDIDRGIMATARGLISRVLCNADPYRGIPRHGPGAVATGESSPEKHTFKRFYRRLAAVFRYDEWFFCTAAHLCDSIEELQAFEKLEAGTAKVVLVPKDSRGPRLISCEPLEYQWIQQALLSVLVPTIENHPLTRGHVNFTDQGINRRLALEGSLTNKWVTLDMKEASDRVSLQLVKELFPTHWWRALYASRSPTTRLPNGHLVHMKKFAPMGSAVCFPVEALVFWALGVATLMNIRKLSLREATANVFVYGDDIVCREVDHLSITHMYPKFGLKLNEDKCCTAGPFKESCGMDAFYGHPVTPTKIRCVWYNYRQPSSLASYVAVSNELHAAGLVSASYYIEEVLQEIWNNQIPVISDGPPSGIAFVRPERLMRTSNRPENLRYNAEFQRMEVKGFIIRPKSRMTKDMSSALITRLLADMESRKGEGLNGPSPSSLLPTGHYVIAHHERLTRAWTPAR